MGNCKSLARVAVSSNRGDQLHLKIDPASGERKVYVSGSPGGPAIVTSPTAGSSDSSKSSDSKDEDREVVQYDNKTNIEVVFGEKVVVEEVEDGDEDDGEISVIRVFKDNSIMNVKSKAGAPAAARASILEFTADQSALVRAGDRSLVSAATTAARSIAIGNFEMGGISMEDIKKAVINPTSLTSLLVQDSASTFFECSASLASALTGLSIQEFMNDTSKSATSSLAITEEADKKKKLDKKRKVYLALDNDLLPWDEAASNPPSHKQKTLKPCPENIMYTKSSGVDRKGNVNKNPIRKSPVSPTCGRNPAENGRECVEGGTRE